MCLRKACLFSVLLPLAVGGLAAWLTMGSMERFAALKQPPLSPPGWLFPVVWTVLYLLMGTASWLVRKSDASQAAKKRALTLYGVQLVVNFFWPLLFFRAGAYGTAFLWLLLLLALVLVTAAMFARICRTAAILLAPYVLWLIFAGYLNIGIWLLNG